LVVCGKNLPSEQHTRRLFERCLRNAGKSHGYCGVHNGWIKEVANLRVLVLQLIQKYCEKL
jgi:hypothetical protein